MNSHIEKVKSFRTLTQDQRAEYFKKEIKGLPKRGTTHPGDQVHTIDPKQLRKFLEINFPFVKAVAKPKALTGALFITDFKILIDNNIENIPPVHLSFHTRLTDHDWLRINIRDIYLDAEGDERFVLFEVYKRIIAHMSKSLLLCDIYHQMANSYARLGSCNRLSVGAIIVKDGRVISTGTNGSPQGLPSCKDVGCLPDDRGRCVRTIHAEHNAILFCSREGIRVQGSVLYCTDFPCVRCLGMLVQSGIKGIYFERDYNDSFNKPLSEQLKTRIEFYQYDGSMFRLTNPMV